MTVQSYRFPTDDYHRAVAERRRRDSALSAGRWLHALRLRFALPDFGPDTPEPRRP